MIRKAIQYIYLLIFFITTISIVGNIELEIETPLYILILFIISGLLSVSKIIYCSIKYPNKKYVWY